MTERRDKPATATACIDIPLRCNDKE